MSGVSGQREVRRESEDVGVVAPVDAAAAPRLPDRSHHRAGRRRTGTAIANRENVTRVLTSLKRRLTADETCWSCSSATAPPTARWPSSISSARTWTRASGRRALDGIAARLVFVNTTSSSFQFVPALVGEKPHRHCGDRFGGAAIRHRVSASTSSKRSTRCAKADNDKNGRLSVWEAFAYASQAVKQAFEKQGTLVTERSVIDDNGDGVGKEAAATTATTACSPRRHFSTRCRRRARATPRLRVSRNSA